MIPTSIDGTDITGATIDGQDVQEITVDGQTVFTSEFSYVDDFDTNTLSDYVIHETLLGVSKNFTISNSELVQPDNNGYFFVYYDVASEGLTDFFVEQVTNVYPDNDWSGVGFLVDGSTIVSGDIRKDTSQAAIGFDSFPTGEPYAVSYANKSTVTHTDYATPFTVRIEYDSSTNTATLFVNGVQKVSINYTLSGTVTDCGMVIAGNDPGLHLESFEIGSL